MNIENLQGRAALTVKRQAAQQTFLHCQIKIGISQDDTGILGLKAEHRAQPMRFRMLVFEQISHPAAADKGQHVDLASLHQWADNLAAFTVDRIHHAPRKRIAEGLEERLMQQYTKLGWLENHGIAHDQRRDQGRECLIERIIERPHAQHHAQRRAPDLADHSLLDDKS